MNRLQKFMRYALGALLLFVAINAFGGGVYGLAGAKDIPVEWLKGSPFSNYIIPSLILIVVVGGAALLAAVLVFMQHRLARRVAFVSGIIMLVWIIAQVAIIGYVSWMQPAIAGAAMVVFLFTANLPEYER